MARPEHPTDPDRTAEDGDAAGSPATLTPVHERWWWTGAFRAVLGAVVVGYQWSVIRAGDATTLTWVVAALGGAVAVWGLWLVWSAWRGLSRRP